MCGYIFAASGLYVAAGVLTATLFAVALIGAGVDPPARRQ
jgi:hypothetical protein